MTWIFLLIVYLWFTGGLGWAAAYEHQRDRTLTPIGKGAVILLWPSFALISALGETVDAAREIRG